MTIERIAELLEQEYPDEQPRDQIAEQLAAAEATLALDSGQLLLWLRDRPRHEISARAFLAWCDRHRLR